MSNVRNPHHRDSRPDFLARMRDCEGKDQLTEQQAQHRAAQLRRKERSRPGTEPAAYLCRWCQCWHVGHLRQN